MFIPDFGPDTGQWRYISLREIIEELKDLIPLIPIMVSAGTSIKDLIKEIYTKNGTHISARAEREIEKAIENKETPQLIEIIKNLIKENDIVKYNQQQQVTIVENKIYSGKEENEKRTTPSDNILLSILAERGISKREDLDTFFSEVELMNSFKQKGIVNIARNGDYAIHKEKISGAKHSIKFMAYYGDGILYSFQTDIIKAINENTVTVRLLLAPKNSTVLYEVLELEGITKKNIIAKCKEKYDNEESYIKEIEERKTNGVSSIEIREYNTQIRYAITIIDDEWAWWTPYHPGVRTEDSISFELINKGKSSFFNLCNSYFNKLWNEGKTRI